MKTFQARSFVQVHYHNRPGGVNTVIGHYAEGFAEACAEAYAEVFAKTLPKSSFANIIICKNDSKDGCKFPTGKIQNIPECDYRAFQTKNAFLKTREILLRKLVAFIRSSGVPKPLCIVGHNLTLGKNCALSSAFAHSARLCEHMSEEVRFLSIIHDFAEEGRIDCIRQINILRDFGIDIWNDLYPKTKNLHFVALNKRNYTLLKKTGFTVEMLANPVETGKMRREISVQAKQAAYNKLISYSRRVHSPIDLALPTLFYPARVISRKNIVEAILLSNIIYKANLLVGKRGPSPAHRALYKKIRMLCVKHKTPVAFNCSDAFSPRESENVFPSILYAVADACLSTSIAEGFGYAFYEPWTNNKCVVGRRPMDFSPLPGMKFPGLYTRLPIPVSWISIHDCARKYYDNMRRYCYVKHQKPLSKFKQEFINIFIKDDAIDFACLDEHIQFEVVEKLLESQSMAIEWERLCGKELKQIRDNIKAGLKPDQSLIRSNRDHIKKKLSGQEFLKNFAQCFFKVRPAGIPQNRFKEIAVYFSDLSHFRLLMAPE
jgi:hypothetical protein